MNIIDYLTDTILCDDINDAINQSPEIREMVIDILTLYPQLIASTLGYTLRDQIEKLEENPSLSKKAKAELSSVEEELDSYLNTLESKFYRISVKVPKYSRTKCIKVHGKKTPEQLCVIDTYLTQHMRSLRTLFDLTDENNLIKFLKMTLDNYMQQLSDVVKYSFFYKSFLSKLFFEKHIKVFVKLIHELAQSNNVAKYNLIAKIKSSIKNINNNNRGLLNDFVTRLVDELRKKYPRPAEAISGDDNVVLGAITGKAIFNTPFIMETIASKYNIDINAVKNVFNKIHKIYNLSNCAANAPVSLTKTAITTLRDADKMDLKLNNDFLTLLFKTVKKDMNVMQNAIKFMEICITKYIRIALHDKHKSVDFSQVQQYIKNYKFKIATAVLIRQIAKVLFNKG